MHIKNIDLTQNKMLLFEQIYKENKDRIYSFLLNILNYNKDDASQMLSETFLKLREQLEHQEIKNPKNWLYTIAHNLAVNMIKKNSKITTLDELAGSYNTLVEEANLNFEQQQIQKHISELDALSREIIQLAYYEEKSYQEIGEILGIPKNTIGTVLFNAKQKLKKYALFFN